ncbi:hypothetical protein ACLB1Q_13125 [Escherichia coli]
MTVAVAPASAVLLPLMVNGLPASAALVFVGGDGVNGKRRGRGIDAVGVDCETWCLPLILLTLACTVASPSRNRLNGRQVRWLSSYHRPLRWRYQFCRQKVTVTVCPGSTPEVSGKG